MAYLRICVLFTLCTLVLCHSPCDVSDDTCWASYARLATNKLRRQMGVPSIGTGPESAADDARSLAEELAMAGEVYTSDEAAAGCGWSARSQLVAAVSPKGNIAEACVKRWAKNESTREDLLDVQAQKAVYAHIQADNGTVYCVQTYVDIDTDAKCLGDDDLDEDMSDEDEDEDADERSDDESEDKDENLDFVDSSDAGYLDDNGTEGMESDEIVDEKSETENDESDNDEADMDELLFRFFDNKGIRSIVEEDGKRCIKICVDI